jgi:hypothetical protein
MAPRIEAALDLALRLVPRRPQPRQTPMLSPHAGDVDVIARKRKTPKYPDLLGMAPAVTVDLFQG